MKMKTNTTAQYPNIKIMQTFQKIKLLYIFSSVVHKSWQSYIISCNNSWKMLIKVKIFSLKINDRSNLRGYVFHFHDIAQKIMIDNSNKCTKKLEK